MYILRRHYYFCSFLVEKQGKLQILYHAYKRFSNFRNAENVILESKIGGMIPKPPRSLLLLSLLLRSPSTSMASKAIKVVQLPFQKFLDPPLSISCKRNKSSLRSSTLRSSHSSCARRGQYFFSSSAFAIQLEAQVLCEGELLPFLSFVSTDVFSNGSRVEACSKSATQNSLIDKQRGVYFDILIHSSISRKCVKSFKCSNVDILRKIHRSLKVARNLYHS